MQIGNAPGGTGREDIGIFSSFYTPYILLVSSKKKEKKKTPKCKISPSTPAPRKKTLNKLLWTFLLVVFRQAFPYILLFFRPENDNADSIPLTFFPSTY